MIIAKNVLFRQICVKCGKTFVQPMVFTTGFRDQIAEPLMGKFVRIDVYIVFVHKGSRIYHILIGKNGTSGIFHSSVEKILNRNLLIVLPRISHADFVL